MKKLKNDKIESFNIIMSREKESSARKVNITMGCTPKTLYRGIKNYGQVRVCPLLCQAFYYMKIEVSLVQ